MSVTLYVGMKKIRFTFQIGWFKGNEFSLIKVNLFYKPEYDSLYFIDFAILKFSVMFGVDWGRDLD